ELEKYPERFSPNAPMRCMYQEKILPNLAYIGGGGELAYWLQLKAMFDSNNISYPTLVQLQDKVVSIEAGTSHNCAILQSGQVSCFGSDTYGGLGEGVYSLDDRTSILPNYPQQNNSAPFAKLQVANSAKLGNKVIGSSYTSIDLDLDSLDHSFILTTPNGSISSILQISTQSVQFTPDLTGLYYLSLKVSDQNTFDSITQTILVSNTMAKVVIDLSLGSNSCIIYDDGSADCRGPSTLDNNSKAITAALSDVLKITNGINHTCILHQNREVSCFGANNYRQLGDPTLSSSLTPLKVSSLTNVEQLALGDRFTCALLLDQTVKCWGNNAYNQLGNNTSSSSSPIPTQVIGLKNIIKIAAKGFHTCALSKDQNLFCWGYNGNGQFGNGQTVYYPRPSQAFKNIQEINDFSVGNDFTCVQSNLGKLFCAGANGYGQLGDNSTQRKLNAVEVLNIQNSVQIASGHSHSCSLQKNGQVFCFGRGDLGQIASKDFSHSGVAINESGLVNVSAIFTGQNHTCAILQNADVTCFGQNNSGNLLLGLKNHQNTPQIAAGISLGSNQAPIIKAFINHNDLNITLNAKSSYDLNRDELLFTWSLLDQPSGSNAHILSSDQAIAILSNVIAGSYLIEVQVNDSLHQNNRQTLQYT
ncbi:bacillithiol biosynthesis BshC, partial [bacterium]|nr:bacillithiol biosynthesis BshC [bacterium]